MMGKIVTHLDRVRQAKAAKEEREITWQTVSVETGIAYSTVLRWAKGQAERFDDGVLVRFCEYFDVPVGELLEYQP